MAKTVANRNPRGNAPREQFCQHGWPDEVTRPCRCARYAQSVYGFPQYKRRDRRTVNGHAKARPSSFVGGSDVFCSQASNRRFCLSSLFYVTVSGDGSAVVTRLARWPWMGVACVASVLAGPAAAQTQQEIDWCNGKDSVGAGLVIRGCTAVLKSKGKSPKDLSTAFNNRGNAYYDKKDYDLAIADYNEALRLDPEFALALYNRSCAYRDKGDNDRAMDDYVKAILLDPSLK